ncbi:hypothetical protein [Chryseobacterium sp.]|uniref:hypothetical protein n=1 Tax=Chryseobacterium sp. TaxID=1871047 RepID=UPI0025B875DD|nr:hypothetical protein [Chryseobacterium sp.]
MKRIAYIELDTHAEIAQNFIEVMENSEIFTVDYYFSKKIRDQIKGEKVNIFLSDSSMILDQLRNQKYDLIIIGTVHRYFNTYLAVASKYNTAVIIHNLNFIRTSGVNLMKNILKEDWIYRLKLWWKEGLYYSSKIYKKAKSLLVLDRELGASSFTYLPLFYTRKLKRNVNEHLVIGIPGGVSQKRRDYQHIFNTIKKLQPSETIEFIFLGKAKGEELEAIEKLYKELPSSIKIQYFTERVSPEDFDQLMTQVDVLWCPIQQQTEFFSQKEWYGKTKMTGNIGDAIKYGKLAVFPSDYSSNLDFIFPEEEDIIKQFRKLKENTFDFSEKYSPEIVLEDIEETLMHLIST